MSKNIKAVPTAEYTAVIATANQYVEGLRVGDAQGVAQAFHKEAVMYGFTNGELLGGPIKNLFDFVEKTVLPRKSAHVLTCWRSHRPPQWCAWTWKPMRSVLTTTTT